jgi:hypothetical protein
MMKMDKVKALLFVNKKTAPRRAEQKNFMTLDHGVEAPALPHPRTDSKKFLGAFFKKRCFS